MCQTCSFTNSRGHTDSAKPSLIHLGLRLYISHKLPSDLSWMEPLRRKARLCRRFSQYLANLVPKSGHRRGMHRCIRVAIQITGPQWWRFSRRLHLSYLYVFCRAPCTVGPIVDVVRLATRLTVSSCAFTFGVLSSTAFLCHRTDHIALLTKHVTCKALIRYIIEE